MMFCVPQLFQEQECVRRKAKMYYEAKGTATQRRGSLYQVLLLVLVTGKRHCVVVLLHMATVTLRTKVPLEKWV